MPQESSTVREILSDLSPPPGRTSHHAPLRIHFPPSTTVSQPGARLTRQETATEPSVSLSVTALSHLTFPNCDLSPTTSAASTHSSHSSLNFDPSSPSPRYLLASLDLDPPLPAFPVLSPLLHSMQADLVLSSFSHNHNTPELAAAAEHWDDWYIPLTPSSPSSSSGSKGGKEKGEGKGGGRIVMPIPALSGLGSGHRYLYMLWEQPEGVDADVIRKELGVWGGGGDGGKGEMGLVGRVRWDVEGFERRLGLGRVVAGNCISSG
ncbi:hypothetical protein QBC47DRAFT_426717 [Echria macrotheca]|uniref:Uncharacterized protein n=1 Tax=Echria macrotheca TaxID=438768 RepID=A0AAJ0EZX2_9PEZI|nr:hypothetical protein QBC47DRAFT_426717 [Echria macrotheca]